ncbi:hypothetical protein [Syntrophomonas curvata]
MRKSLTTFILIALLILAQASFAWAKTDTGSVDIIVDLTPPEVNITGVTDGGKYSSPVIPIVSAQDNSGEVTVAANLKRFGQIAAWLSGQEICEYGTYILSVSAIDRAGNKAGKNISFTLATYAGLPTISIDKDQYTTGDKMTITVTDYNRIGQENIEVISYGIQGNPRIICSETNPGIFEGSHTFIKELLSGGFYVRYDYDISSKKYIEASGRYVISLNNGGGNNGNTAEAHKPHNESPITELPGNVIGTVEGNEVQAPSGDTAFFKPGADGQYEYVPSIYDPASGKYTILGGNDKYVMVTLPSPSTQSWASPAKDWFENRGIAPPAGENITTKDVTQVAARATGINPGISGSTFVTPAQMEQIINNILKASPVKVNQAEINKWANERRNLSKPLTKSEVVVTMYWFLQKANMAK